MLSLLRMLLNDLKNASAPFSFGILVRLIERPVANRAYLVNHFSQIGIRAFKDKSGKADPDLRTVVSTQYRTVLDQGHLYAHSCSSDGCSDSGNSTADNHQLIFAGKMGFFLVESPPSETGQISVVVWRGKSMIGGE